MSYMTRLEGVPDRDDVKPGMAHFAGTGPSGKTCGKCKHYQKIERVNRCLIYRKLTGDYGPSIKRAYRACRHFEDKPK